MKPEEPDRADSSALALPGASLENIRKAQRAIAEKSVAAEKLRSKRGDLESGLAEDQAKLKRIGDELYLDALEEMLADGETAAGRARRAKMSAKKAEYEGRIPARAAAIKRLEPDIAAAEAEASAAVRAHGGVFAAAIAELQPAPAAAVNRSLAALLDSFADLVALEAVRKRIVPTEFDVRPETPLPFAFDYRALMRKILAVVPERFRTPQPDIEAVMHAGHSRADIIVKTILNEEV